MKLLLDTHIWVWSVAKSARVGSKLARTLRNPESEIWLSPINVWELLLLGEKRRISLLPTAEEWIQAAMRRLPFREAPLTLEVVMETTRVKTPHRDPADRFLVATARVFDLILVTADQRLLALPDVETIPNN